MTRDVCSCRKQKGSCGSFVSSVWKGYGSHPLIWFCHRQKKKKWTTKEIAVLLLVYIETRLRRVDASFPMHPVHTLAFVHFRCSVAVIFKNNLMDIVSLFFGFIVFFFSLWFELNFSKFTKDQNQTNTRKLRVSHRALTRQLFPVPQCHVAEQKECQGFNVPRLYHSALSLNAAVLVVLTVCCKEPTAPLHCPSHTFGFLVTRGWIWAGSSVLRPRGCRHRHTSCFLWISSTKLITYLNHGL